MMNDDTVKLLRECDAGVKMGISSIDQVSEYVESPNMKRLLSESRQEHEDLGSRIEGMLRRHNSKEKDPNPMAAGMSRIKTNFMLAMKDSDQSIASLMVDGCAMGTKSLSRYLNKYPAADEDSRTAARQLIEIEDELEKGLRPHL